MNQKVSDSELNKAALVIAKLLILTRDGKIIWQPASSPLSMIGTAVRTYFTPLEGDIDALMARSDQTLNFELVNRRPDLQEWSNGKSILSIALAHSYSQAGRVSPEGIVYADLAELFALAEDPKSVSSDFQIKQLMSYLDRLAG